MTERSELKGPWIVWTDYGYEGWQPKSYATAEAALTDVHYSPFILTMVPKIEIVVNGESAPAKEG